MTEYATYLFGWIGACGFIMNDRKIAIEAQKRDAEVLLGHFGDMMQEDGIPNPWTDGKTVRLIVESKTMVDEVRKWWNSTLPDLSTEAMKWSFVRGYFDGCGWIQKPGPDRQLECRMMCQNSDLAEQIAHFCKIHYYFKDRTVLWYVRANALDFLSKLYDRSNVHLVRKRNRYLEWSRLVPAIGDAIGTRTKLARCLIVKTDEEAVFPFKMRASDVGYDLTVIREIERLGDHTALYDTGIQVQPEHGWYVSVVPRSSLAKTGYILANSVGIVDPSYTGSIKLALTKIDLSKPDLFLPARVAQLIFSVVVHFDLVDVNCNDPEFVRTERGGKGYGSSG